MPARSEQSSAPATRRRPRVALVHPGYWRYLARLEPWTLLATPTLLGIAWAARSDLDNPLEMTVFTVLTTLALCAVFDDDACAFTAAAPTPLWARRLAAAATPFLILALTWAVTVALVTSGDRPAGSTPWWAMALEWATVAASQLTLGAVTARRSHSTGPVMPGLILAVVWLAALGAPMFQRHVEPPQDHLTLWCGLLAAAAIVIAATSRDPARRAIGRSLRADRG